MIWAGLTLTVLSLAIIAELTILNIVATGIGLVMPLFYLGYVLVKYHGAQYEMETAVEGDKHFELIINEDFQERRVEQLPPKELLLGLFELDKQMSELTTENSIVRQSKIMQLTKQKKLLRSQFPEFYEKEIIFMKKELEDKLRKQREVFSSRDHEPEV